MSKRKLAIAVAFLIAVGMWSLMSLMVPVRSVLSLLTKWKVQNGSVSVLSYTVEVSNHGPWPIVVHDARWNFYPPYILYHPVTDDFELIPFGTQQVLGGVIGCGFQGVVQCPSQFYVNLDAQATMLFKTDEITLAG